MVNVGVIGYGYWGPNIVRNFNSINQTNVNIICDQNESMLKRAYQNFPHTKLTTRTNDVLTNDSIDAVAVVTPVSTHYNLARKV